jgi:hypothetical protein
MRFLDHTQQRTTIGRTPLDEWSVRRRDLYLTTHNTHNKPTSMPPLGFEPTISAGERPKIDALDRAGTGTGTQIYYCKISSTLETLWTIESYFISFFVKQVTLLRSYISGSRIKMFNTAGSPLGKSAEPDISNHNATYIFSPLCYSFFCMKLIEVSPLNF